MIICCICIVGNGNVILNLALFQKLGVGSKRARCPVLGCPIHSKIWKFLIHLNFIYDKM